MRRFLSLSSGLLAASLAKATSSSYENNLAYSSPSRRHPSLGVPLSHVVKRQAELFTPEEVEFTHGIASGDPYEDSVILWTRLAPTEDSVASEFVPEGVVPVYDGTEGAVPETKAACVEWRIATDEELNNVVDQGRGYTTSDVDYTVKFEAKGLQPFTTYYYQFNVCDSDKVSLVGRTRTLPARSQKVPRDVNFAVYSCSNYPEGYFNAYANTARKDTIDYVLHLGDYIYEYQDSSHLRTPQPDRETYTLYDYRRRLGTYRTDEDLLTLHSIYPFITVWDDHEVADNSWKNGSHNSEGDVFLKRKEAAVRAYFEWMPLRQVDMDDTLRIWRNFSIGNLADLMMLDTRHYARDLTVVGGIIGIGPGGNIGDVEDVVDDPSRTLMGFNQEAWFYDQLSQSSERGARWRLVGTQVVFSHIGLGIFNNRPFNRDQWDGYLANRDRIYQHLADHSINNTIILAGDSHASWVSDLAWINRRDYNKDTGAGSFGVEFAGTAVSSHSVLGRNFPNFLSKLLSKWLVSANPELQWQDLYYRGYFELSVGYEEVNARFFGIPDPYKRKNDDEILLAEFKVYSGENRLARSPTVGGGVAKAGALKNGKVVSP